MGGKGKKFVVKSLRVAPVNGKILKKVRMIISLEPQSPVGCVCIVDGNRVRQGLTRGKGQLVEGVGLHMSTTNGANDSSEATLDP